MFFFGKFPCKSRRRVVIQPFKVFLKTRNLLLPLPPILPPDSLMVTWAVWMLLITVPSGETSTTSNVSSASSRWSRMISACQLLFDTPAGTQKDFYTLARLGGIHLWFSSSVTGWIRQKLLATWRGLHQLVSFSLVLLTWPDCGSVNIWKHVVVYGVWLNFCSLDVNWLLVDDLWPLRSGCREWLSCSQTADVFWYYRLFSLLSLGCF